MIPRRVALPYPLRTEGVDVLSAVVSEVSSAEDNQESSHRLSDLLRQRQELELQLELMDAEVTALAIDSICGMQDDSQDVELYDGTLGVPREFVDTHEQRIGQLQWLDDLAARFTGPNDSPGNVSGARWGSGGLITDDLFITAGHCFDQTGGGWSRPRRNGQTVPPQEIATLMRVNFNFQIDGQSGVERPGESFPVAELVEYRTAGVDYAVARLGRDATGQLAGERFGRLLIATTDLTTAGAMLCVIQHPNGSPKKIEAGPLLQNTNGQIRYDDIDTLGGSSGSPVLGPDGTLVGVHTNGGCTAFSGFNFGVAVGVIRALSTTLP